MDIGHIRKRGNLGDLGTAKFIKIVFKLCNKLIEIRFGGQGRAGSGVYIQKIIGGGGVDAFGTEF